ncbi:amidohydrolase family protein [Sulfobacillus thermosulfidooxidans]|uniref:amidohydrolase family protein n=1 Tax=Sulfobacillus thermosulfidooxidans TaxID=28034 RepID=UPI0006B41CF5|nr:amidohydrolase family protein [Sulfobacillus thermosulfidooxidans]
MPVLYRVHLVDNPRELVNIRWNDDGQITQIEPYHEKPENVPSIWASDIKGEGIWDGEEGLVLPGLVDAHTHLDKAKTYQASMTSDGTVQAAIREFRQVPPQTPDGVYERVMSILKQMVSYGTTLVRTHIDSYYPDLVRLSGIFSAMMAAKEAMKDKIEVQFVLMCPGEIDATWSKHLCEMRGNLSALGGAPWLSPDPVKNIQWILDQATRLGLGVDLHIDETLDPEVKTLEWLTDEVLRRSFSGSVVASHVLAIGTQDQAIQRRIARAVGEAEIHIVSLPQTNCYLQGRESPYLTWRGITPMRVWKDMGVNVALASDNMQDLFHPWGNGDLLQVASLALYAAQLQPRDEIDVLRAISYIPRLWLKGDENPLVPSRLADLLVLPVSSAHQVFSDMPAARAVFKQGRLISRRRVIVD